MQERAHHIYRSATTPAPGDRTGRRARMDADNQNSQDDPMPILQDGAEDGENGEGTCPECIYARKVCEEGRRGRKDNRHTGDSARNM